MQTFLPYPDFNRSARVLDDKRLGKQRVEAMQIYKSCVLDDYGWKQHPAVKMWKGYETALLMYMDTMIHEWERRGFKSTMGYARVQTTIAPPWLGDEMLHSSHRSNLLRKDKDFYSKWNWTEKDNMPYFWCGFAQQDTKILEDINAVQ
tara:strand:- start:53 stop:496 length:444 start_codon:yes stop_codon:yes gene_type:complete